MEPPGKLLKLCSLINPAFYFIDWVYIVERQGGFRLIANHKGNLLFDKHYKTLHGAKIAFSKLFKHLGWKKRMKAQWSPFYEPDSNWLKDKKGTEEYMND
jgi:hypothetical protein